MIEVQFNGEKKHLPEDTLLSAFLPPNHPEIRFAVAINSRFVPPAHYTSTYLKQGDIITLVAPMSGG